MILYILLNILFFSISILLAKKFNLYDYPNFRKNHLKPVINVGGFPIIFSIFSANLLFDFNDKFILVIFFSMFFLVLGFIDDIKNLNPFLRILAQFFLALVFLYLTDIRIINIFLTREVILPMYLSYIFSACCILVIINSFNYFDGLDLNLIFMVIFFSLSIHYVLNFFSIFDVFLLIIPMVVFSFLNYGFKILPKMYLGDNGSNSLGFLFASIFLMINNETNHTFEIQHKIIWLLAFPAYEFLATTISRKIRKKNIFEPGNDHIHYVINKYANNVLLTSLINIIILISFFLIGNLLLKLNPNFSFVSYIICFCIYFTIREKLITRN